GAVAGWPSLLRYMVVIGAAGVCCPRRGRLVAPWARPPAPACTIIAVILWPHFLLLRAAGLAASLGTAGAYHCMAPQSQIFGATIASGPDPRQLALTFDDGPNDPHTERLLYVLAEPRA